MDFANLHENFLSNQFTDIEIILKDESCDEKIIKAHKIILCSIKSPFFKNLLAGDFSEQKQSKIVFQIPCVHIATLEALFVFIYRNKIPDIDGMQLWQYLLELFLCFSYLGMPYNPSILGKLVELEIPVEDVPFLFYVANALAYTDHIIVFISDNLPECNLDGMPEDIQPFISAYHMKRAELILNKSHKNSGIKRPHVFCGCSLLPIKASSFPFPHDKYLMTIHGLIAPSITSYWKQNNLRIPNVRIGTINPP